LAGKTTLSRRMRSLFPPLKRMCSREGGGVAGWRRSQQRVERERGKKGKKGGRNSIVKDEDDSIIVSFSKSQPGTSS